MSAIRWIAMLLATMLAFAFLNGSALADESQDTDTKTETSAPADETTPPVDAPPPADTEGADEGASDGDKE